MARKALEPGMVIELQRQGQEGFEAFTMTDKFASSFNQKGNWKRRNLHRL